MPTFNCQDGLLAITTYFNPLSYRRRLANYRTFRRHLGLPLLTVELSFDQTFELGEGDAEILIQLRGGDVLWQKERLLNVGLAALPKSCHKVVWVDADTIAGSADWPAQVSRALDEFPIVQCFSRVGHLSPDSQTNNHGPVGPAEWWQPSLIIDIETGIPVAKGLRRPTGQAGFAWAARRQLLDEHGFYDASIVGGGDHAMACAAYGDYDAASQRQKMNRRQWVHYLAWAEPFFADIQGAVSFVDCPIYNLWHGAIPDRRYQERHDGMSHLQFDPSSDLAIGTSGAWRWNSEKPLLHQYVNDYFALRKEDGDGFRG